MKRMIFAFSILFLVGAAVSQAAPVVFCENLSCGNRFSATSGWQADYANTTGQGHGFCYEILAKGNANYKVKVLAIVGGEAIHLDCARNLASIDACINWLTARGYQLKQDGAEAGGPSGGHLTVGRGPIYKIPAFLYVEKK